MCNDEVNINHTSESHHQTISPKSSPQSSSMIPNTSAWARKIGPLQYQRPLKKEDWEKMRNDHQQWCYEQNGMGHGVHSVSHLKIYLKSQNCLFIFFCCRSGWDLLFLSTRPLSAPLHSSYSPMAAIGLPRRPRPPPSQSDEPDQNDSTQYDGLQNIISEIESSVTLPRFNGWVGLYLCLGKDKVCQRLIDTISSIQTVTCLLLSTSVAAIASPASSIDALDSSSPTKIAYFFSFVSSSPPRPGFQVTMM